MWNKDEQIRLSNCLSRHSVQEVIHNSQGDEWYYKGDLLHREDGPAYIGVSGHKEWYINGQLHRLDGPAIIYCNGKREWYKNGKLHREDGPAIEGDGWGTYFYNGKYMPCSSTEQFIRLIKLKALW